LGPADEERVDMHEDGAGFGPGEGSGRDDADVGALVHEEFADPAAGERAGPHRIGMLGGLAAVAVLLAVPTTTPICILNLCL
jgi:hypothetical protein